MPRFPLDPDEDPARTPPPPQAESPKERGFGDEDALPEDLEDLVRISEFDDLDSDSDIADEGAGHRG